MMLSPASDARFGCEQLQENLLGKGSLHVGQTKQLFILTNTDSLVDYSERLDRRNTASENA